MKRWSVRIVALPMLLVVASLSTSQAGIVLEGYDLLNTVGAAFDFTPFDPGIGVEAFRGEDLGSFNFPGIGVRNTGNADTIVHRSEVADGSGNPIAIELVALSLVSVNPIDVGGGLEPLHITVAADNGSRAWIRQGDGTFDTELDIDVLIEGENSGAQMIMPGFVLNSFNTPWVHQTSPPAVLIEGVNYLLNGVDTTQDFHIPLGQIAHHEKGSAFHDVEPATPEPSSLIIWCLLGAVAITVGWWRRTRKVT